MVSRVYEITYERSEREYRHCCKHLGHGATIRNCAVMSQALRFLSAIAEFLVKQCMAMNLCFLKHNVLEMYYLARFRCVA